MPPAANGPLVWHLCKILQIMGFYSVSYNLYDIFGECVRQFVRMYDNAGSPARASLPGMRAWPRRDESLARAGMRAWSPPEGLGF